MGQCVIKDCGFNVQKLNEPERQNLNQFLKERIKDRYSFTEKSKPPLTPQTLSSFGKIDLQRKPNKNEEASGSSLGEPQEIAQEGSQNEIEPPPRLKTKESSNSSHKNLKKFKDLSLNETLMRNNKHFFTPKRTSEEFFPAQEDPKRRRSIEFPKKGEQNSSPMSTANQTEQNNDRRFQTGFQNNFFNPIAAHFDNDSRSPTPTKIEFGNIFTEEELSDISGDLEHFEKKFPQEIIKKYSKKK